MEKHKLRCAFTALAASLLIAMPSLAQEEEMGGGGGVGGPGFLIGPSAELLFVRGVNYPTDTNDSKPGLLLGLYAGTSGLEIRPQALIVEGQYRGFILDAGVRVTPKWFGGDEYLFNILSPYAVLGGSLGYPWSVGWHAKAGIGVALMQFGSINAEIGFRSHRLDATTLLDSVTIGLRATYPF